MNKWTQREFWYALLPFIIGILTTIGVIGPEDGSQVGSIILMVGPSLGYIIMRIWQKVRETELAAAVKIAEAEAALPGPPAKK